MSARSRTPRPLRVLALLLAPALAVAGCTAGGPARGAVSPTAPGGQPQPAAFTQDEVLPPCPELPPARPRPDGLPDLRLPCLGAGPESRLSDLRGVPTVVTFWAAWCSPCEKEMRVVRDVQDRAGDRVRFVAVHVLADRQFALGSAARFGVTFPSLHDEEGKLRKQLPSVGPPATYFVAPDGRLAGPPEIGQIDTRAELAALLEARLGVRL